MQKYNYAVIRELVGAAFDDESLSVFCHDRFEAVYEQFTSGQTKGQRILILVDHAKRNGLAERLLSGIRQTNPYQYAKFESRLKGASINGNTNEEAIVEQPPKPQPDRPADDRSGKQPASPLFYAVLSLFACLVGIGLLFLFISVADNPNTGSRVFYIVVTAMGASAGAFLFGAMRSYATYSGKALGGLLELGGPIVVFAGVVAGGFLLVPSSGAFDVTVYVHGPGGKTDRVLANRGKVTLELGQFPRTSPIRENGDAHFDGIPSEFFNREVLAMIDAEGFEPAKPDAKLLLNGESVYLEVKRDGSLAKIAGTVKNTDGDLLQGVTIRIGKLKTQTDADGWFELVIPPEARKERQKLTARLDGHETWEGDVYPGTGQEAAIIMTGKRTE